MARYYRRSTITPLIRDVRHHDNEACLCPCTIVLSELHEASLALRKACNYAFPDKKRVHIHPGYDAKLDERVAGSHA